MRVLIDYRAALRERSGVGEYTHQLVRALLARFPRRGSADSLDVTLFSSSWKDRLGDRPDLPGASLVDRRVPVRVLNLAWHRLGWPPAETLTGQPFDVTHSMHPLLLPSTRAAQVVTIHDLNFLSHPERTRAEVRRDYGALARDHAHRADGVIAISRFTAREVERELDVEADRVTVCTPGAPDWTPRESRPQHGYILFLGTLEPRKNVGGLLDAYDRLLAHVPPPGIRIPDLVLAGKATEESRPWLERIARPPLAGRVRHIGYVDPADRRALYEGARLLVQPSFDEGFGLPVLEAMTIGVPVVASDRGALPEVLGDAGPLVDPDNSHALAAAMARMIDDDGFASACAAKGVQRSHDFSWERSAERAYEAYQRAFECRRKRSGAA